MPDKIVTVCDACLRASCWQGIFYCDDFKHAGTVDMPVSKLIELDREHFDYWKNEDETDVVNPFDART